MTGSTHKFLKRVNDDNDYDDEKFPNWQKFNLTSLHASNNNSQQVKSWHFLTRNKKKRNISSGMA